MENNEEIKYAGFWVRVLAFVIDGFIISIPLSIVNKIFGEASTISLILGLFIWWFYTSKMLSSSWRGTVGKKVLGLEVYNIDLMPLSFKGASKRFAYSLITYTILFSPKFVALLFVDISELLGFFVSFMVVIPIVMMVFNNKRQVLHDLLAKTVVIDREYIKQNQKKHKETEEQIKPTKKIGVIGIIRGIGILILIVVVGYQVYLFSVFAFVYGSIYKHNQKKYDNSFHITYKTNDFNDSRIIYYNKELERYSKEFIEADSMYEIFAADVKKDLALNCLESFIKEHNETAWIDMGSNFRKNARNKYANTEEKIKKAKKNEDYMGKHFYDYDLNDVNHIEDEIADVWSTSRNEDTCQVQLSTEKMYEMFIFKYIQNREEALAYDKREHEHAKPTGTLNKSFYKKSMNTTSEWLNILYRKHPGYMHKQKRDRQTQIENFFDKASGKIKMKDKYDCKKVINKEISFNVVNDKNQTPLIVAILSNNLDMAECLLGINHKYKGHISNISHQDKFGKTAFDYYKELANKERSVTTTLQGMMIFGELTKLNGQ